MKPTDEQLREIGMATYQQIGSFLAMGRAAFEASCQIALAEPTGEEVDEFYVPGNTLAVVQRVIANRLRSLTAEPKDEAVLAVGQILADLGIGYKVDNISDDKLEQIVAAVDKARGRK